MRNHEKKTNAALTFEENKSYHVQNICYIWKTSIYYKKYYKVRYQCRYTGKYRNKYTCSLRHNIPKKKNPVVFYTASTYAYHFIINELAEKGQFKCLRGNKEKYITFSVLIKKD